MATVGHASLGRYSDTFGLGTTRGRTDGCSQPSLTPRQSDDHQNRPRPCRKEGCIFLFTHILGLP